MRVRGSGPLVVKLPGLAGGVELYREEMDAVAAAGYRVAAVDNTGDRHDDPATAPITWDLLTAEAIEAIEGAGGGPAVLWGTSFGCLIALATAAREPGRVAGLLLCVPPEPGRLPALQRRVVELALRRRDSGRASRVALALAMVLLCGWEFLAPPAMRRLPGLYRASREAATPYSTFRDKFALLLDGDRGLVPSAEVPVSIIAGAWDLLTPRAGARRLARRLARARLTVIGGAGHALAWTRPRTYAGRALGELRRLSGG